MIYMEDTTRSLTNQDAINKINNSLKNKGNTRDYLIDQQKTPASRGFLYNAQIY